MNFSRRAALFLAFALPVGAASGVSSQTTLVLPDGGSVTLELAQALTLQVRTPTPGLLLFTIDDPGGARDKGSIRVVVKGAGARTRPESVVAEASTGPTAAASNGVWLERSQDGISVYQIRTPVNVQELRVFKAADGVLVGVRPVAPGSSMSVAERRYKDVLEVIYQASRELDASPQELDRYVLDYLAANIDIVRKTK